MPRRRPISLRQRPPLSWTPTPTSRIAGLSGSAAAAISRLEHARLQPGDIERAYRRWQRLTSAPLDEIERADVVGDNAAFYNGCDCGYCGPVDFGRRSLERAMRMLPSRAAAELSMAVGRLDQQLEQRLSRDHASHLLSGWW